MSDAVPGRGGRRADWGALLVLAVVLASAATSLGNGFAYDDVPIVRDNEAVHAWRWPWRFLGETYWAPPWGYALYRPVTIASFSVQWMLGGGAPLIFHVVNVTAYAAAALLLLRLARDLMRPMAALVVAVLWAAHPVHVEVVGNIVGQSELWVALGALGALLVIQRIATDGRVTLRRSVALLLAVVWSLGAKENGVVLPVLVAGLLATRLRDGTVAAADRVRGWILVRACAYVLVAYLAARYAVLGTLGGDGSHPAIADLPLGQRVLAALALRVTEARLLLLGGPLAADYAPPVHPLHTAPDVWHLLALGLLVSWALLGWRLHRARRPVWPVLWVPLAMAPTSNVLFATGIVMAERSLFVPSLGVALALGVGADLLVASVPGGIGRSVRRAAALAGAGVLVLWIVARARRQSVWRDSHALAAASLIDAPESASWQRVLGAAFLRAQEFDRAETHLRIAETLGPPDPRLLSGLRTVLERQGRCDEALPYYRRAFVMYERTPFDELGFIGCLLRVRRYSEARAVALGAGVEAAEPEPFRLLRQLAESALVATDTAGATNLWRSQRRPVSRSDEVIAVRLDDRGRLLRFTVPPLALAPPSSPPGGSSGSVAR